MINMHGEHEVVSNNTLYIKSKINLTLQQFQQIFYPTKKSFSVVCCYLHPKNAYIISQTPDYNVGEPLEIILAQKKDIGWEEIWLTSIQSYLLSGIYPHTDKVVFHCSRNYEDLLEQFEKEDDFLLQLEIEDTLLRIVYHVWE